MANRLCRYTSNYVVKALDCSSTLSINVDRCGDTGQDVWVYQKYYNSSEGFVINYQGESTYSEWVSQLAELIDRIGRVDLDILKEIEPVEKTRQELVKKHGQTNKDGGYGIPDNDFVHLNAFFSDFNEVLDETVQVDYQPLNLGALNVSPNDLKNLMPFLDDDYLKQLEE